MTADDELDAVEPAAPEASEDEAPCDSDDSADADEFELVDDDDGDDDDAVETLTALASGGDSGILRDCNSNLAFSSSTLLNLNLLLSL